MNNLWLGILTLLLSLGGSLPGGLIIPNALSWTTFVVSLLYTFLNFSFSLYYFFFKYKGSKSKAFRRSFFDFIFGDLSGEFYQIYCTKFNPIYCDPNTFERFNEYTDKKFVLMDENNRDDCSVFTARHGIYNPRGENFWKIYKDSGCYVVKLNLILEENESGLKEKWGLKMGYGDCESGNLNCNHEFDYNEDSITRFNHFLSALFDIVHPICYFSENDSDVMHSYSFNDLFKNIVLEGKKVYIFRFMMAPNLQIPVSKKICVEGVNDWIFEKSYGVKWAYFSNLYQKHLCSLKLSDKSLDKLNCEELSKVHGISKWKSRRILVDLKHLKIKNGISCSIPTLPPTKIGYNFIKSFGSIFNCEAKSELNTKNIVSLVRNAPENKSSQIRKCLKSPEFLLMKDAEERRKLIIEDKKAVASGGMNYEIIDKIIKVEDRMNASKKRIQKLKKSGKNHSECFNGLIVDKSINYNKKMLFQSKSEKCGQSEIEINSDKENVESLYLKRREDNNKGRAALIETLSMKEKRVNKEKLNYLLHDCLSYKEVLIKDIKLRSEFLDKKDTSEKAKSFLNYEREIRSVKNRNEKIIEDSLSLIRNNSKPLADFVKVKDKSKPKAVKEGFKKLIISTFPQNDFYIKPGKMGFYESLSLLSCDQDEEEHKELGDNRSNRDGEEEGEGKGKKGETGNKANVTMVRKVVKGKNKSGINFFKKTDKKTTEKFMKKNKISKGDSKVKNSMNSAAFEEVVDDTFLLELSSRGIIDAIKTRLSASSASSKKITEIRSEAVYFVNSMIEEECSSRGREILSKFWECLSVSSRKNGRVWKNNVYKKLKPESFKNDKKTPLCSNIERPDNLLKISDHILDNVDEIGRNIDDIEEIEIKEIIQKLLEIKRQ